MELKGKLVVITGAARGIGAAAAREFAAKGAKLALIARSAGALQSVAGETGGLALPCDVADAAALRAAIARAEAAFGPVEVMINNAGVIGPVARITEGSAADFNQTLAINIGGVYNGMQAVLPGMISRGRGVILTVGSGAAYNPLEGWAAYCSSKAGAFMLTRAAHLEAGPAGVRVLSLSPGTVATDMQRAIKASGINPVSQLDWSAHVPPEWPAKTLVWMCGPEASRFDGAEVSLREEEIRRAVGLIA
jgi:NAD(P)-dependent dehydrogenase (short-subunit alcohol dehydrogenase family)